MSEQRGTGTIFPAKRTPGRTVTGTEDGASPRSSLVALDVDVGISQVISMLGNRSIVQEIAEGLATGWPIGQPVASRLASPISFNHWGLGFYWQDWPGWPRWHCCGVFKEAVLFVFLVFFQRRQIESPVFIEWRLPMSLRGAE